MGIITEGDAGVKWESIVSKEHNAWCAEININGGSKKGAGLAHHLKASYHPSPCFLPSLQMTIPEWGCWCWMETRIPTTSTPTISMWGSLWGWAAGVWGWLQQARDVRACPLVSPPERTFLEYVQRPLAPPWFVTSATQANYPSKAASSFRWAGVASSIGIPGQLPVSFIHLLIHLYMCLFIHSFIHLKVQSSRQQKF